jgi:hypothetical protein
MCLCIGCNLLGCHNPEHYYRGPTNFYDRPTLGPNSSNGTSRSAATHSHGGVSHTFPATSSRGEGKRGTEEGREGGEGDGDGDEDDDEGQLNGANGARTYTKTAAEVPTSLRKYPPPDVSVEAFDYLFPWAMKSLAADSPAITAIFDQLRHRHRLLIVPSRTYVHMVVMVRLTMTWMHWQYVNVPETLIKRNRAEVFGIGHQPGAWKTVVETQVDMWMLERLMSYRQWREKVLARWYWDVVAKEEGETRWTEEYDTDEGSSDEGEDGSESE